MKIWRTICGGILLAGALGARAEYWFDDFDSHAAGPLDGQGGWAGNSPDVELNSGYGHVSVPYALELPQAPSGQTRSAIYDGLDVYCRDRILRLSLVVYRSNPGPVLQIQLRDGITTRLEIADTSGGNIVVNGHDTGTPFSFGGTQTLSLFYNETTGEVALDQDSSRILDWTNIGVTAFTTADNLRIRRYGNESGIIRVDNVSVQTIPEDTAAWWRFEEDVSFWARDETGRFEPAISTAQGGGGIGGAEEALEVLFNGEDAVLNHQARGNTRVLDLDQTEAIELGSYWMIEFIARFSGVSECTLFEWINGYPPWDNPGAWIRLQWDPNVPEIAVSLRDDEESGADYATGNFYNVPDDDEWHHVAIVKALNTLYLYVDYRQVESFGLVAEGNGFYTFDADAFAYIGMGSSNSSTDYARDGMYFDEVRVSSAVDTDDFLRMAFPRFTRPPAVYDTTCLLYFNGVPNGTSTLYRSTSLEGGTWTYAGAPATRTNTIGREQNSELIMPAGEKCFFRIE